MIRLREKDKDIWQMQHNVTFMLCDLELIIFQTLRRNDI